ncbi:hypothetical protein C0J52_06560 [Blattella germanica]|nr:hypothetical protein C0J52_06560 [Blattella germanica]
MTLLNEILVDLDGCNRELKKKLVSVEQCCDGNDSAEIFQSSASHPSPSNMIEWAQDSWRLYHMSHIGLCEAFHRRFLITRGNDRNEIHRWRHEDVGNEFLRSKIDDVWHHYSKCTGLQSSIFWEIIA